ncbi:hypothetical protein BDD18_3085 [Acidovorax temperans]|uniref:Uncharacterized protein n=1 Tax=Acidovorax temperans TaxID=80878 RepID=A0A543L1H2_9BURK|nr:hypothetical protein BDD18_3085 [Acidovorax temperans]
MTEQRYRHEMRRMIDRALQLLERGELTWKAVAQWFEAYRVPFEVTCRVPTNDKALCHQSCLVCTTQWTHGLSHSMSTERFSKRSKLAIPFRLKRQCNGT